MNRNDQRQTITEPELVDCARAKAVKSMKVVPCPDKGGYELQVTLTWKDGDLTLVKVRNKNEPRTWSNIDRLVAHISEKYGNVSGLWVVIAGDTNDRRH